MPFPPLIREISNVVTEFRNFVIVSLLMSRTLAFRALPYILRGARYGIQGYNVYKRLRGAYNTGRRVLDGARRFNDMLRRNRRLPPSATGGSMENVTFKGKKRYRSSSSRSRKMARRYRRSSRAVSRRSRKSRRRRSGRGTVNVVRSSFSTLASLSATTAYEFGNVNLTGFSELSKFQSIYRLGRIKRVSIEFIPRVGVELDSSSYTAVPRMFGFVNKVRGPEDSAAHSADFSAVDNVLRQPGGTSWLLTDRKRFSWPAKIAVSDVFQTYGSATNVSTALVAQSVRLKSFPWMEISSPVGASDDQANIHPGVLAAATNCLLLFTDTAYTTATPAIDVKLTVHYQFKSMIK
jgi:hypothetical protein